MLQKRIFRIVMVNKNNGTGRQRKSCLKLSVITGQQIQTKYKDKALSHRGFPQ